jgi:AcrR family transcriptional regulator
MNTVSINSASRLERHKQRTRQALMQAAYELVMAQGYESLTVSAIADAAGYGRATFYLYFARFTCILPIKKTLSGI